MQMIRRLKDAGSGSGIGFVETILDHESGVITSDKSKLFVSK